VLFSLDALKAAAGQQEVRAPDSRASEDILTLGGFDAMGSPLSAPLIEVIPAAPVMTAPAVQVAAPVTQTTLPTQEKKTPIWLWGAGAAAVLLVGFFGVRTMLAPPATGDARTATTTEPSADPAAVAAEEEAAKKKAEEEAAEKKAEEEAAKKKAEEEEAAKKKAEEEAQAKLGSGSSGSGSGSSGSGSSGSGSSGTNTGSSSGSTTKGGSESGGSGAAAGPFNVGAAKSALSAAAGKAKLCKKADGPTGSGKVQVTFASSGRVTSAVVVAGPFGGTSVGGCVAKAFRGARVPAFSGSPTTVAKSFSIN
jgi:outer membrane biosynthesis protein TonB